MTDASVICARCPAPRGRAQNTYCVGCALKYARHRQAMIDAGNWVVRPQEKRGKFRGVDIDRIHYLRGAITRKA